MMHRWTQYQLARALDEGAALSPKLRGHLEACAECQERFHLEGQLASRLRLAAGELESEVHSNLRCRIMDDVRKVDSTREPANFIGGRIPDSAVAPALVAVLLVFALLWEPSSPEPELPRSAALGDIVLLMNSEAERVLAEPLESLSEPTPIERELAAVEEDLLSSFGFLAGEVIQPLWDGVESGLASEDQ